MHSLFNTNSSTSFGVPALPEWSWVRDGLRRNIGTVISYYHQNPRAVRSNHFLVRLLGSVAVPKSLTLERYYSNVDAMSLNVSMALKMTSSIYQGELFSGIFYGEGTQEILIAHREGFDVEEAHAKWQYQTPVRVLRHPRSDLSLSLPNGYNAGVEKGLAVIAVNIPLLAVQYRAFRMVEQSLNEDRDSQRSLMQFVHMYVLPNMLTSQTDYALFNRINNVSLGRPVGQTREHHPFVLPATFADRALANQRDLVVRLRESSRDFAGILASVPVAKALDLKEALRLPSMAPTRQVDWALTLARLPALGFLFRVSAGGGGVRNQSEVNRLQREALLFQQNQSFRIFLPSVYAEGVQREINEIVRQAGE